MNLRALPKSIREFKFSARKFTTACDELVYMHDIALYISGLFKASGKFS